LTEGSKRIGFGHITRCISVYQALSAKGLQPEFIINGDKYASTILKGKRHTVYNWLKDRSRTLDIVRGSGAVIIDSYLADAGFYREISRIADIPIYIDDNMRLEYPAGTVVNGSVYAKGLDYPKNGRTRYLLGTRYMPLRKDFWSVPQKAISSSIRNIMITFGGSDDRNMTPKILKMLAQRRPSAAKSVIIGKGFTNISQVKKNKDKRTRLIFAPDATGMKNIMLNSDIAISSAGQTLYELARIGLPTIAVVVADNQVKNAGGWQRRGFVRVAGAWDRKDIADRIALHMDEFDSIDRRKASHGAGRRLMKGRGARLMAELVITSDKRKRRIDR
jgi:spore coat polysaccharide biosynthesis predicted glycosyltransferase SpsG